LESWVDLGLLALDSVHIVGQHDNFVFQSSVFLSQSVNLVLKHLLNVGLNLFDLGSGLLGQSTFKMLHFLIFLVALSDKTHHFITHLFDLNALVCEFASQLLVRILVIPKSQVFGTDRRSSVFLHIS